MIELSIARSPAGKPVLVLGRRGAGSVNVEIDGDRVEAIPASALRDLEAEAVSMPAARLVEAIESAKAFIADLKAAAEGLVPASDDLVDFAAFKQAREAERLAALKEAREKMIAEGRGEPGVAEWPCATAQTPMEAAPQPAPGCEHQLEATGDGAVALRAC